MSPSLNAQVLAGRYRLENLIASGGMGKVWRAVDLVLDRPVAVKVLHAEYACQAETIARFRAEARHAANLSHPSIAQVYDFGEGDGLPSPGTGTAGPAFLVMEFIDGPPLTKLVARGPLELATVLDMVAQVSSGLAAAHAAGIVHRDIKPGNLLVDRTGQIKITDFGIAYALGSAPLTRTGALIGTPGYLAPERVSGHAAVPASDVYSLGVVAYECLTGSLPFTGTAMEIALAAQMRPLPPLPDSVPHEVVGLIADLTARDPARRPARAGMVAARAQALRTAIGAPERAGDLAGDDPEPGDCDDGTHPTASHRHTRTEVLPLTDLGGIGADDRYRSHPVMPSRRGWPHRSPLTRAALGAAVIAVVASLAVWALASRSAPAPAGQASTPPSSHASTSAGPRVTVNAAALLGQPVRDVVQHLRQIGLVVDIQWQRSDQQHPGTVLSVQPSGKLPPGTTVAVTGASRHRHGRGHDHGRGGQNGQGGD